MVEGIQDILIYNIYKIFYDREPNLSIDNKDTLNIEIQGLIFLLDWLEVKIGPYTFDNDNELGMPISKDLDDDILTLTNKNITKLSSYNLDLNNPLLEVLKLLKERLDNKSIDILKGISKQIYDKYYIDINFQKIK